MYWYVYGEAIAWERERERMRILGERKMILKTDETGHTLGDAVDQLTKVTH